MAGFDPKAYLSQKDEPPPAAKGFDPADYAAKNAPKEADKGGGMVEYVRSLRDAGMRGVAQGATAGFADEATAGIGSVLGIGKVADEGIGDVYRKNRDAIRQRDAKAAEEHPVMHGAGVLAGTVLSLAAPGLGTALRSARTATEVGGVAAKTLGPVGSALVRRMGKEGLGRAVVAGGEGGIAAAGASKADLTEGDVAGLAKDMAPGVALGAGAGFAAEVAGPLVAKVPGAVKDFAERRAFKAAVGNQQALTEEAARKGIMNSAGRDLLDEGVVTLGSKAKGIAKRAEDVRKGTWGEINGLLAQVDQAAPKSFNATTVAAKIRDYAQKIGTPNNKATVENLLRQADEFEAMGQVSLAEAQRLKNSYKWDPRDPQAMPIGKEATNEMKRIIGDEMEVSVKAAGRGGEYGSLKDTYGSMATAGKGAKKLAARQDKNRTVSLSDSIFGAAAGAATMSPLTGLGTAVGNKLLRERGSSSAAVVADKLASVLSSVPQAFGRFAPELQAAAKRGPEALAMTHTILLENDPAYAALFGAADESTAIQRRLERQK